MWEENKNYVEDFFDLFWSKNRVKMVVIEVDDAQWSFNSNVKFLVPKTNHGTKNVQIRRQNAVNHFPHKTRSLLLSQKEKNTNKKKSLILCLSASLSAPNFHWKLVDLSTKITHTNSSPTQFQHWKHIFSRSFSSSFPNRLGFLHFPTLLIKTAQRVSTWYCKRIRLLHCSRRWRWRLLEKLAGRTQAAGAPPWQCGWRCRGQRRRRRREWWVMVFWFLFTTRWRAITNQMPRTWKGCVELLSWLKLNKLGECNYHPHCRHHRNRHLLPTKTTTARSIS